MKATIIIVAALLASPAFACCGYDSDYDAGNTYNWNQQQQVERGLEQQQEDMENRQRAIPWGLPSNDD